MSQESLPQINTNKVGSMTVDKDAFDFIQRVAKVYAVSDLVPTHYKNNVANCIIAIEMSNRMQVPTAAFMQDSHIVHGKPGLSGKFAIGLVNKRGGFKHALRFEESGQGDKKTVIAWTTDMDGNRVDGPPVSIETAKKEGWYSKNPKWKSIPELMLRYRAGAWFARLYCPDLLCGLQTVDELQDVHGVIDVTPEASELNTLFDELAEEIEDEDK